MSCLRPAADCYQKRLLVQNPFWDRIQTVRERELHTLWRSFLVAAINSFLLNAIPTFVSVTTFTVYVLLGNELTAAKAFTSLSLFSVRQSLAVAVWGPPMADSCGQCLGIAVANLWEACSCTAWLL